MIYIGYIGLTWGEGGFWSWYVGYLRYIGGWGGNLGIENPKKKIRPQYFLRIVVNSKLDVLAIINNKFFKIARSNKLIFTFFDKNAHFSL